MNSSRNIFVFGFSMFCALVIPHWILENPGFIATGIIDKTMSLLFNSFHLNYYKLTLNYYAVILKKKKQTEVAFSFLTWSEQ